MKPDVGGVYRQLLAVRNQSIDLLNESSPETNEVAGLFAEYKDLKNAFFVIAIREGLNGWLRDLTWKPDSSVASDRKGLLRQVIIQCEKGIGLLSGLISPLSKDELDRLQNLRKELEQLSPRLQDVNFERNVAEAIDEYERGHPLASVLISSRIIIYVLKLIPGNTDEERIRFLREKGVIEKKREDTHQFILKASHKARDFFSHDLKLFPSPSDALSLLGDTLKILELTSQLDIIHDQK